MAFVIIFVLSLFRLVVSILHGLYPPTGFLISKPLGTLFAKTNLRIIFFGFVGILLSHPPYRFSWLKYFTDGFQHRTALPVGGLSPPTHVIVAMVLKVFITFLLMGRLRKRFGRFSITLRGLNILFLPTLGSSLPIGLGKAKGKTHIFHIIPILICWFLWCCRNDKRVDNVPFTTIRVCDRIWKFIHSINLKGKIKRIFWKGADKIAFVAGTTPAPRPIYSMVAVRWIKPTVGWWKLNTDGAALGSPGVAAAGGDSGSP
ncbi:hypothetical protein OROMI_018815 [Orobanche minor]